MSPEPAADLRALPRTGSGWSSTVVWGIALLVLIEAVGAASLLTSYFYLRVRAGAWPPAGHEPPALALASVAAGALAASVVPVAWAERAARRGAQRRLKVGLLLGLLLLAGYAALSVRDLVTGTASWDADIYGSILWTITGHQLMHVLVLGAFAGAVAALAWRGHFDRERRDAVQAAALYWYFVAASGLLGYATVHVAPRLL
ncbi:cytochrome c oxidase subunit 3 [Sorangium sp. So ce233]|uniref:cytochrome c oxidase subunit 3 n=1 Tax=Sorangium sp. So ce233 TaxID=3133290 RepID=UPI003F5D6467